MSHRALALAVLCAVSLMVVLDGSIVAVALPSIQNDLGFTASSLAWVVNAYLIAFGGLLLVSGRLGDLIGRKRVFMTGLGVFTLASLLCGVARDQTQLVVFRFLQGAGGALASAVVLGMITTLYPEPRARAKAIGVYSFTQAAGSSIGLIAGGTLTQLLDWHWTFFVNLPIGVVALALAVRLLEADRGTGLRRGEPLVPLRIFCVRTVLGANTVMILMVAGLFGFQFITALYLQRVLRLDVLGTGFAFLPAPVSIAVMSLVFAERLNHRFGARKVLVTGLSLVALALGLLATVEADGNYATDVLPALVLMGAGFGAAMPALMGQAMSGVSPADAGVASGLINTTQQIGAAIGTAVLATAAASRTGSLLADGTAMPEALTGGYRIAYALSTGLLALAVFAAAVALRERKAQEVIVA
ncbi:MFS transporter [Amycolatopsis sp. NPDC089917]|uniref:MFS transporter n=1 Tax=Amycolatopsis sp. NPDC089917 TaxID=3155187 RepID=UPI00343E1215